MIYTLFFSRLEELEPADQGRYHEKLARMQARARENPGFVDQRAYTGEDGERLTIVRFRDLDSQDSWRSLPEHMDVQREGRRGYYAEYHAVVCEQLRETAWNRDDGFVAAPAAEGGHHD